MTICTLFHGGHPYSLVEFLGGGERGNNVVQGRYGGLVVVLLGGALEFPQVDDKLVCVNFDLLANKEELVARALEPFFVHQEFFFDFFAGAESGKLDLNVFVRDFAVHADQVFGECQNFYGLPHIEHKDFAAPGVGACMHHKAHRFGHGHEIADNVGVCNRDGTALFDLPLEDEVSENYR